MLEVILDAVVKVGNKVGNLTENQLKILSQIGVNPKISAAGLSKIVGISKRKIEENLAKLKEQGLIIRAGGTRGHWQII